MEDGLDFTVNDIGIKCRSKREVYTVLSSEGGIFLPPIVDATQKYLRALMLGDKSYVKCSEVKVIRVPHLEGLRVKDILHWARERVEIDRYIPNYEYQKEPNREWFVNLVNTLLEEEFKEFINDKWRARELKVIKNKNLGITAKNEFVEIFRNSKSISTSRGKTYFLARSTRERVEEIKDFAGEEEEKHGENETDQLKKKIDELSEKLQEHEMMEEEASKHKKSLAKLYDLGIVNSDGEYVE